MAYALSALILKKRSKSDAGAETDGDTNRQIVQHRQSEGCSEREPDCYAGTQVLSLAPGLSTCRFA